MGYDQHGPVGQLLVDHVEDQILGGKVHESVTAGGVSTSHTAEPSTAHVAGDVCAAEQLAQGVLDVSANEVVADQGNLSLNFLRKGEAVIGNHRQRKGRAHLLCF